jgi:protein-glucosylgalactosylhydroxylysine glucosidase
MPVRWKGSAALEEAAMHSFRIRPCHSDTLDVSCLFSESLNKVSIANYDTTRRISKEQWYKFWTSGGAVDFSGSTYPRAWELERRIILSQYLLRIQCSGSLPPQETGLTYNSLFGKFHLELSWWHMVYTALWGRIDLLEKCPGWYFKILPSAQSTVQGQGFAGARWPKMTDPSGNESPSNVGSFLIWQQPHPIYFAELLYRHDSSHTTLHHYKDLVFAAAKFMAPNAWYDSLHHRYVLGPALIPAQERYDPVMTINPSFELAYWQRGLATAQRWRVRVHMPREKKWDDVLAQLSSLSQSMGLPDVGDDCHSAGIAAQSDRNFINGYTEEHLPQEWPQLSG